MLSLYVRLIKNFLVKETKHHVLIETKESAQLFTGAWSDRIGRKWLIVSGMWIQTAGIVVVINSNAYFGFAFGVVMLGIWTEMVNPTLLASIADVAHPSWRATSVGVYRFWRDLGYAIGAL